MSNWKIKRRNKYKWAATSTSWFITWFYKKGSDLVSVLRTHQLEWIGFTGQIEKGAMGHLHLQCVVCWAKPVSFSYVRKLFMWQAHIEPTMDVADATTYCLKVRTRVGPRFWMSNGRLVCNSPRLQPFLIQGIDPGPD